MEPGELAGDDLLGAKINDRRTQLEQAQQTLPEGDFSSQVSHLQANLATLQNDLESARALLPSEQTQVNIYNRGTIDLLDASLHRQEKKNKEAFALSEQAISTFQKAQAMLL